MLVGSKFRQSVVKALERETSSGFVRCPRELPVISGLSARDLGRAFWSEGSSQLSVRSQPLSLLCWVQFPHGSKLLNEIIKLYFSWRAATSTTIARLGELSQGQCRFLFYTINPWRKMRYKFNVSLCRKEKNWPIFIFN